ncbi:DUF2284 domain-containing protein [Flammeovirga aprica]|uniref:DUF2284 domain-containing protein n=1 Tax=Flammeovirga aprica JL-4 TaxID=694437 RepID=A0A7X9XCS1_9BACT|nr:DUF2284 domain-containing protein [Flammeovirga aprica]NME72025.1 DUF2284 domain-containing protein [Flammeovirga aprica JL-4]
MLKEKKMINVCQNKGAFKAHIIDIEKIIFDEKLRAYCEVNHCGHFGKNYACPPSVGEVDDIIAEAKGYNKALVYQTVNSYIGSFDNHGVRKAIKKHDVVANKISKEIDLHYEKHLDLRAGPCTVCKECTIINNEPCKYPEKKRASLEAYCINVSSLAEECKMDYNNGEDTVTFFGAFLLK